MFRLQLAEYSPTGLMFRLRIVEQTSTRLAFQIQPWAIWIVMGSVLVSVTIAALVKPGEFLLAAPIFIIPAILGLLRFGQIIVCDFDRTTDQFRHEYRGLFKSKHKIYPVSAITQVQIQTTITSGSSFRVVLALDSGQQVPLISYYNNDYPDKLRTAQLVAGFLQVELLP